jgi:hypothetical protein
LALGVALNARQLLAGCRSLVEAYKALPPVKLHLNPIEFKDFFDVEMMCIEKFRS